MNPASPAGTERLTTAPPGRLHGRRAAMLVATLIFSVFSFQLNASMLAPALPNMARSLNTSIDAVSNVQSVFFLAAAVGGVMFTRWSDFIGRRRSLLLILVLLTAGTLLCIVAPSLRVILIGRVLQGASSATLGIAYVTIKEWVEPKTFGLAIGAVGAANAGIAGVDALLGGYLADTIGFRAIFVIIMAVVLVTAVLVLTIVPKDHELKRGGRMDWWGLAALALGLVCLTKAISTAADADVVFVSYLLGTIIGFVAFWYIEKAQKARALIQPRHLRSRRVWPLLATTVFALAGVYSVTQFTVVILSQDHAVGFGLDATTTALLFLLPPAIMGAICGPITGRIADRTDWVGVLRIGMFACVAILIAISLFTFHKWIVFALVLAIGITLNGMVYATMHGLSVLLSPKEAPGALAGLNGSCFGIGAGLGITLVAPFVGMGTESGYTISLVVSILLATVAAVCTLLLRRPEHVTQ